MKNQIELKPMQWVLVKYAENEEWALAQFSHMSSAGNYVMCGGTYFSFCIPYKGNKHLLGTTDTYVETKSKSEYVPKDGETYYSPELSSRLDFTTWGFQWDDDNIDNIRKNKGWVFRTEEECQEKCNRLNEAIKNVK